MRGADAAALIYKICPRGEWDAAVRAGHYAGSADDARDGYIHLSTATQARTTAAKYFARQGDLVLVAVDPARVADRLRWEPARGGTLFPHIYGVMPVSAALSVLELPLGADGMHKFPEEIA